MYVYCSSASLISNLLARLDENYLPLHTIDSKIQITMPKFPRENAEQVQFIVNLFIETDKNTFHSTHPKVVISILDTEHLNLHCQTSGLTFLN